MFARLFFSLMLSLFVSLAAFADTRTQEEAQRVAISFLTLGNAGMKFVPSSQSVTLGYTLPKINSTDAAAYLFQIGEDRGFVLVSADDNATAILGYSNEGSFDATDIPENMQVWLQHYAEEISWVSEHIVSRQTTSKTSGSPIPPLLGGIEWNQGSPFWNQCPYDSDGRRSPTGCVATAAAQIMRYWKYPATGQGSHSYVWIRSNGTTQTLSANFGSTTYDWDKMLPSYNGSYTSSQANAVATLMYHLGVATEMKYTSLESGTPTEKAGLAMFTYFGYDKSMRSVRADFVGYEAFGNKMLEELLAGRPVLMSGRTEKNEGHAFVCDGYDGELFHINWGWGGSQNGYYALSALSPVEQGIGGAASGYSFTVNVAGIMGIMPDQGGELTPVSLGTIGLKLQAQKQIKVTDRFTIKINQIKNTGLTDYAGGNVGLAVLDKNNSFVCWFSEDQIPALPIGTYYGSEYDFSGYLSDVKVDGKYMIAPIYTDAAFENFWLMDVGFDSPKYFAFTKSGSTIIFDDDDPEPEPEYYVNNLTAYSEGNSIHFSFESNAPKFHVKVYNETQTLASGIVDFKNVVVSNVPDGVWTVWVRPCDAAEERYVADAVTATVTVGGTSPFEGDVNDDQKVDVKDIELLTAYILGKVKSINTDVADLNHDGVVDVTDIVYILQIILNANSK